MAFLHGSRTASVASLLALVLLAASQPARASHGGPITVEVIGWDAADERIYVRQRGHDESGGERDCVFYFDLRASAPASPRIVRASLERWSPDTVEMAGFERERARLERFLRGLIPLVRADEGEPSFIRHARVVDRRETALAPWMDPAPRFIVDVGDSILVTTWKEPRVRAIRRYRIPGREGALVVLSFLGDPNEEGYEVQRCVLTRLPGAGVQRLDSRSGVLPWPPRR